MNLDWKTLLTGAVTWTALVAGGTWTISQRYTEGLRETIASYEKAKSWKVPEAIAATEQAATELGKLAAAGHHIQHAGGHRGSPTGL